MSNEVEFLKALSLLAHVCSHELDELEIAFYDQELSVDYNGATRAIREILRSRRARDPFPSIKDIKEKFDQTESPDKEAVLLVGKIIECVRKRGYTWSWSRDFNREVMRDLGEHGVKLIKAYGGWGLICETANEGNLAALRAQLREVAVATIERARREEQHGAQLEYDTKVLPELKGMPK